MKIILLNAPPRSGKDTAAELMTQNVGGELARFAEPIKAAGCAIYCGGDRELWNKYDSPELKDIPQDIFFGKTCRQVQIAISEQFLKLFHGQWIFGKLLVQHIKRRVENGQNLFFVSGSGFRPEAEELIREFGADSIVLIRTHRPGYTYEGDSRNYINLDDLNVLSFDVQNDKGIEEYYQRIKEIVAPLIGVSR